MARNDLTQWLYDRDPKTFVVYEAKRWLMAPARKDQDYGPALFMDLRETAGAVADAPLGRDYNLMVAESLATTGQLPLIVVWFHGGKPIDSMSNFKVFMFHSGGWDGGQLLSSNDFHSRFFPGTGGASKKINIRASNVYHEWQRRVLPDSYVFHDLDVIIARGPPGSSGRPFAVLEHKQSFALPEEWNKTDYMTRDAENYRAELKLAETLGLLPCAVYHCYKERVGEDAPLGVFRITRVMGKKVDRTAKFCSAGEFAADPWQFL